MGGYGLSLEFIVRAQLGVPTVIYIYIYIYIFWPSIHGHARSPEASWAWGHFLKKAKLGVAGHLAWTRSTLSGTPVHRSPQGRLHFLLLLLRLAWWYSSIALLLSSNFLLQLPVLCPLVS